MAIRIFADANILIAGADSKTGASNAVIKLAEIGLCRLVVSHQVLEEAERNLRNKLPRALTNFEAQIRQLALEVVPDPSPQEAAKWEHIIEAKDAPILAAAVIAQVDPYYIKYEALYTICCRAEWVLIKTPSEFIQSIRTIINTHFGRLD